MIPVRAKKHLGQHFLRDENIAQKIVAGLKHTHLYENVLEIGPGTGMLTKYLIKEPAFVTHVIENDENPLPI